MYVSGSHGLNTCHKILKFNLIVALFVSIMIYDISTRKQFVGVQITNGNY